MVKAGCGLSFAKKITRQSLIRIAAAIFPQGAAVKSKFLLQFNTENLKGNPGLAGRGVTAPLTIREDTAVLKERTREQDALCRNAAW